MTTKNPHKRKSQRIDVHSHAIPKEMLDDYYLANLIANPLQSTIMVSHRMFSGVLDKLKKKICRAHGGGYVPYQIGRFSHGHKVRPETRSLTKTKPNDYCG